MSFPLCCVGLFSTIQPTFLHQIECGRSNWMREFWGNLLKKLENHGFPHCFGGLFSTIQPTFLHQIDCGRSNWMRAFCGNLLKNLKKHNFPHCYVGLFQRFSQHFFIKSIVDDLFEWWKSEKIFTKDSKTQNLSLLKSDLFPIQPTFL